MRTSGAVYGSLLEGGQPRRGDLWGAALDRLARHVTLEEHGEDAFSIVGNAEHVAAEGVQDARQALSVIKGDGSSQHTSGNEVVGRSDSVYTWC